MRTRLYVILYSIFLVNLLQAQAVGQTVGDLSVSLTGGASYAVPVANLPSVKGAVPNISLTYSSQSKNGVAGWGWNISGASSISRIPSTKFHDGVIDAVDFDDKDRFALDGQRLILKSGVYGADGAEYQTENYSNIKVVSHGVSPYGPNYGPAYFMVYYPNGNTAVYGNTSNSRNQVEWKVNYIDDVRYNRIEFLYFIDKETIYLSSVKYGGNPSSGSYNPMNTVNLIYKDRTRSEQMFIYGNVEYIMAKALDRIEVAASGQLYRKYQLTHNTTSLGYERLIQVQEFNGNGESVKPIIFEYDNTDNGVVNNPNAVINNVSPSYDSNNWKYLAGYFDNDSAIDFFTYPNSRDKLYQFNSGQLLTANSNVSGSLINVEKFSEIFSTKILLSNNKFHNLDAVTTIGAGTIVNDEEQIKVNNYISNSGYNSLDLSSTKTYSFPVTFNESCITIGGSNTKSATIPKRFFTGDFDGDGLSDVIALTLPYSQSYTYACNTGGGGGLDPSLDPNKRPIPNNCCIQTVTMDYSQAYLMDLNPNSAAVPLSIGGNTIVKSSSRIYIADFEGDGKADLYILNGGQIAVYGLENGAFVQKTLINSSSINFDYPFYLTDLNGDGKTDMVIPTAEGSSSWYHLVSNGKFFSQITRDISMVFRKSEVKNTCYTAANGNLDCGYIQQIIYYNFADINGDGKADLFYHSILAPYNVPGSQWNYPYNTYGPNYAIKEFGSVKYNMSNRPDGTANFSGENMMWNNMYTYNGCTANGTPLFLSNQNTVNQNLDYAFFGDNKIKYISFKKDNRIDTSLKRIKENDLITDISYDYIKSGGASSGTYIPDDAEQYPNINLNLAPSVKLVRKVEKSFNGESKIQEYKYKGAVVNMEGLGFIGFKGIARSSAYGGNLQPFWTISLQDIQKRGAAAESYVLKAVVDFNSPSSFISKTVNTYNTTLSPEKVFTNLTVQVQQEDHLSGVTTQQYYDVYDAYNNPKKTRIVTAGGDKTTLIDYEDNPAGISNQYYVGRPVKKTETQVLGNDTFSTEELYTHTNGLLTQIKRKGHNTDYITEDFTYDVFGNNTEKTISAPGVLPRTEKNQYDTSGRFAVKTTNIQGISTLYNYDSVFGSLLSTTNHLNQTLSYAYDSWQRKSQDIDIYSNITNYSYDWITSGDFINGIKLKVTEPTGAVKETITDNWGRVRIERGLSLNNKWIEKRTDYDILDKPFRVSDPYFSTSTPNRWTVTEYDDYGRITKTTYPTGKIITSSYSGLSATVVDGQKTQTITKDAWGNKIQMSDNGGIVNYSYFANGALKSSNYAGHVVSIEQDGWGRKTKMSDPSVGGDYTYVYDNLGQILKEENPKGKTEYTYDAYGRVIKKNVTGDNTDIKINYTYTAQGLSDSETGTSNGISNSYTSTYDTYYRLAERVEDNGIAVFKKRYTYDNFGRIKKETKETVYGVAISVVEAENNYASCGMLESIVDGAGKIIWKLNAVNEKGQVLSAYFGNGTEINNVYDAHWFLSSAKHTNTVSGAIILDNTYAFEASTGLLNNRNNAAIQNGWYETFGYDSQQRLVSWTNPFGTRSQTYDAYGRIGNNSEVGDYLYGDSNRYRKKTINLNPAGNSYYSMNQLQEVTYNAYKSPVSITQDGYELVKFNYNIHQTRSGSQYNYNKSFLIYTRNKVYADDSSVEITGYQYTGRTNGSAIRTRIVTYVAGNPYSAPAMHIKDFNAFGEVISDGLHYIHRDYQGTISAISDKAGKVEERRQFDAWGSLVYLEKNGVEVNPAIENMNMLTERGYTAHEHFFQVGLIHMNGRMYDPKLHTFLSVDNFIQDPFNTQNYNRYGYVLNNPLMYTDPSGEFVWALVYVGAIIGAVMGATSYIGQAIQTGDWNWGKFGMSVLGGAVAGAISGALDGGASSTLTWGAIAGNAAMGFVGSFMNFNLDLGLGFSIGISPSIAFGNSFSIGASLNISYRKGDFAVSASITGTYYNKHAGSGVSGWGYRYSAMAGTLGKEGNLGIMLGTNIWGGVHAQQTGILRVGSGDFSLTYENDGSPFAKGPEWTHLGDNNDRWRTAAMTINVGDFHAGFNLFTGVRMKDSYAENGANSWDAQRMKEGACYSNGACLPNGYVQETGPKYRMGAAYIGWGNYRVGIDSDRHVRHPIQNILAHDWISAQPGFEVLSTGSKPYFQYQTANPFTSW